MTQYTVSSSSVFYFQSTGDYSDYSEYSEYDVHASGRCDSYLTSMLVETIGDRRSAIYHRVSSSSAVHRSLVVGGRMVASLSRIPFPSGFMGQVHGMGGTRERVVSP